jgi:hypothetical protein
MSVTWITKAIDYARAVVISIELAAAVGAVALGRWWPDGMLSWAGVVRTANSASSLTLFAVPVLIIVGTYRYGEKLLQPEGARAVLVQWPDYWRLKARAHIAVGFSVVGGSTWEVGLLLIRQDHLLIGATISIAGLAASLTALGSVAYALWDLRDILDGVGDSDL